MRERITEPSCEQSSKDTEPTKPSETPLSIPLCNGFLRFPMVHWNPLSLYRVFSNPLPAPRIDPPPAPDPADFGRRCLTERSQHERILMELLRHRTGPLSTGHPEKKRRSSINPWLKQAEKQEVDEETWLTSCRVCLQHCRPCQKDPFGRVKPALSNSGRILDFHILSSS